jgi:hypothetical protein
MATVLGATTGARKDPSKRPPTIAVKIDRPLVAKARLVAADRDLDSAAHLSELIRGAVGRDFDRPARRLGTTAR